MAGLSGKALGGFRILEQIDEESGQGIVCKAICEVENPSITVKKGQVVALKVMPVRDDGEQQQWRRLENRTKELARIAHPNVVRYYGCFCEQGEWNQLHIIVQEFLEGETLKNRLKHFASGLDVDEGLKIIGLALDGLAYTAAKGIVHRDIKPGNIFICEKETRGKKEVSAKLIDFEIARQGHGSTTASTGNLRGSFNYMAPEFLDARFRGDILSDIYSMGVTLHETLTGKLPYESIEGNGDDAILDFVARWKGITDGKNPVAVSSDVNRLLAHTDKIFAGCLSTKREERFQSFEEFREALKGVRYRTLTNPVSGSAYQMLQFIGKGGFGEVFKARESKTGDVVAIKHLRKAKYADRFKREAKILSKFDDNCFVRFVESFQRDMDGKVQEFLVMGFLEGMPGNSLWDAIKKTKGAGLPKKDILKAFIRYAHGLRLLHSAGIFHRDIKPSNLYFPAGKPEQAAIMDLGIARDTKGTMTVGSVPGTPDYMPPEIVTAGSRGESGMDIYALGLCLYEALTAKSAFPRLPADIDGFRKLVERVNSKIQPRFDDKRVDDDLLELLCDMTAFNPEHRIKDARDVERRLRELLEKLGVEAAQVAASEAQTSSLLKKVIIGFVLVAGLGAALYGAFLYSFPRLKKLYAERRLAIVLAAYKNFEPSAADIENGWIIDFNPNSCNWLRLDEAMFVDCTNRIAQVRYEVMTEKTRKDWLARLGACMSDDGSLAQKAYQELNSVNLPAELEDDDEVQAKLGEIGLAIRNELVKCLTVDPLKTRRDRLKAAEQILANHWTIKVIDSNAIIATKKAVADSLVMCVGRVHNATSSEIEVGGEKLRVNETKTITIKDGRPELQLVAREGYLPIPLPTGFEAMTFDVDDSTFVIKPIQFTIPKLAEGETFILRDKEYRGGEDVELNPGRYIAKYSRGDRTSTGEKIYKDYFIEFSVTSSAEVTIPRPGNWEYTDEYKAFLTAPVEVELPALETGVVCMVDGKHEKSGRLKIVPGKHICIYERPDYIAQTNAFEILPGKSVSIAAPQQWKTTKDVKRLQAAGRLFEQKQMAKLEEALEGIHVEAPENVREVERLRLALAEWKKAEGERLERERRAAAKKLETEKVAVLARMFDQKQMAKLEEALAGIYVEAPENVTEVERLKRGLAAWKKAEAERLERERIAEAKKLEEERIAAAKKLAADRKALTEKVEKLIETEPISGRRKRLASAKSILAGDEAKKILEQSEQDRLSFAIQEASRFVAGRIKNNCDFDFAVNGTAIQPGTSRLIRFDSEQSQGVTLSARGYDDLTIGKTLDEKEVAISNNQWVMADVAIKLRRQMEGVECYFNGAQVRGEFKVKPGRYELMFKRDGYEPQFVEFVALLADGCTVEAPSKWEALPVEVSLRELEDGVKCFLGNSLVSRSIRLIPGKSYEFRYEKDDCVEQRVRLYVEVGREAEIPSPSFWVETEDVNRIREAEELFEKGKLDEASAKLATIRVSAPKNVKRVGELKEKLSKAMEILKAKREKERAIGAYLEKAELAYTPEDLLGGSARDCIQAYYGAVISGYKLTAQDRKRIQHCYQVGSRDLRTQRKSVDNQILSGVRPFRNPNDIDNDTHQLNEWYNTLRK